MSKTDSSIRFKHAQLSTQQRRLRHLRSIAARNIKLDTTRLGNDVSVIETYFTLHKDNEKESFYHSERIKGSLNPTFRSFNLSLLAETRPIDTYTPSFVVRIWQGNNDVFHECIQWHVSLSGLVFLGDKAQRDGQHYPPNTLIFGILDGFYGAQLVKERDLNNESYQIAVPDTLTVDISSIRDSYSPQTVSRIQTILRAITQTQASVLKVKNNIEDKLSHSKILQLKKSETELRALRVNLMRSDLEWRTMQLQSAKEHYEQLQSYNYQKDIASKTKFDALHKDKNRLHEKKKGYFDIREELIKNGAQLVMRRKQLISELAFIYPIIESQQDVFTICGVRLPNSEDFAGQDETMIAVSLSYTCHLVQMISQFLDVPLRYPMEHRGSRSQIKDHIIDKLSDRERDFPLYSKGKERFQFNYGVYLLNKNIAQLRYYCGLGTTDLRLTLPNLKTLLELRLGVKFDSPSSPTSSMPGQHLSIPPNLSGPAQSSAHAHAADEASEGSHLSDKSSDAANSESNVTNDTYGHGVPATSNNVHVGLSVVQVHQPDSLATSSISQAEKQELLKQGYADDFIADVDSENVEGAQEALEIEACDASKEQNGFRNATSVIRNQAKAEDELQCKQNIPHPAVGSAKTVGSITREKLLGNAPNFEDIDVSSEESVNAVYRSRFKEWPAQEQLGRKGADGCPPPDETLPGDARTSLLPEPSDDHASAAPPRGQPSCDSGFKTFKTRAMLCHADEPATSLNDDIAFLHAENSAADARKAYHTVSKDLQDSSLGEDGEATFQLAAASLDNKDVRPKLLGRQNVETGNVS